MKILAVSDEEAGCFYDCYSPGRLAEFDLILSCGDLHQKYLEFLVTMARCPLLYVHGNHDESYAESPPEGCVCIEDSVYTYNGVRILGLGGCNQYRDGRYMYTESQMRRRIARVRGQIRRNKGFDILLTHAPARGVHDLDTQAHRGFECFGDLIEKYRPRYHIHGHVHSSYSPNAERETMVGDTCTVNACGYRTIIM